MNKEVNPGNSLHYYLDKLGFHITPGCGCEYRIQVMNEWGSEKCLDKLDTIARWLKREAFQRGLPFNMTLGKRLIRKAILKAVDNSSKIA